MQHRQIKHGIGRGRRPRLGDRRRLSTLIALVSGFNAAQARAQQVEPPQPSAAVEASIKPPEVLRRIDAAYPPSALAARQEAKVVLLVSIDASGAVVAVTVAQSGGEAFDRAAIDAMRNWVFSPARRGGEAVSSRIRVPFDFFPPALAPVPIPSPAPATSSSSQSVEAASAASSTAVAVQPASPVPLAAGKSEPTPLDVTVVGRQRPPSRGASDYRLELGDLASVPRTNAAEALKLAPGVLLTNEGGEAHAEQVFLRGFDAREGQDIEFTVDGVPINESGNLHGNGYADTHFIIPEVIDTLRVVEGPFDPRQGNYAVAGSAEYQLGLAERGVTVKVSAGSYGTYRELFTYGPPDQGKGTFVAGELYQTNGFGMNRDGRRGSAIVQYEGNTGTGTSYRLTGTAYVASFHTAGVLRDDDYRAGRVGFFDTYDPLQGEDSSRYSLSAEIESHAEHLVVSNQAFVIVRPLSLRENFTGFLLDVQEPLQQPHSQRGDLLDLNNRAETLGLRGSVRATDTVNRLRQELEVGYFARGDFVASTEQRIEAATGHPYHTDVDLDSTLGDVGLYADANLRLLRWLVVRGGVRGDLFTYDVDDKCAVQSVAHPSPTHPPGDESCLSQQSFGAFREPNQPATTASAAYMPRGSLIIGPFFGTSASLSAGTGVRSIDPSYITADKKTPFASVTAYEAGLSFQRDLSAGVELGASSVLFDTKVDRDLIFSQTAGRNVLGGATTRLGSANALRVKGAAFDLAGNLTYVKATFDDTHLLIPYVPDLVLRGDGAVFGDLFNVRPGNRPLRATFAVGVTYVAPRPLPYGSRSDPIFTLDDNLTLGWSFLELGVSVQNLLDARYRLGEFNYASDFHSQPFPTLVPVRHFSAGAPRTILVSLALNYGGAR